MWQKVALATARSPRARRVIFWLLFFLIFMLLFAGCSILMMVPAVISGINSNGGGGAAGSGFSTCTAGYTPSKRVPNPSVVRITYNAGRQLNVSNRVMLAGFEAMLVESNGRMYANVNVPASFRFPHDAVGSDHLSVNQFQQQFGPGFTWNATIADAMNPDRAARSFFNAAIAVEKRGFFGSPGQLADEVQRSAFPSRYDAREVQARALLVKTRSACLAPGASGAWVSPIAGFVDPNQNYGQTGPHWITHHTGEDYPVPSGTQVHAASSGRVIFAGWNKYYGWFIKIDHGNGIETWYAHNSHLFVKVGDTVGAGNRISLSGATGNVTGPHVHFEVRINGVDTNPDTFLRKHGVSI